MNFSLKINLTALMFIAFIFTNISSVKSSNDDFTPNSFIKQQSYLKQINLDGTIFPFEKTEGITIGVLDTGIDLEHSFLKKYLVQGVNILNPDELPVDDNGHGTGSAGVLATIISHYDFKYGDINIMPIKTLDSKAQGDIQDIVKGVQYAIDHKCKIILLSLGLHFDSIQVKEIIETAEKNDVLVVSATGNDGQAVQYPAAYPTVLGVGGVDDTGIIGGASSYGSGVDLVAPWDVYTTKLGGGFNYRKGTSMAAPQVAAVASLILKRYPKIKPYQIRNLMIQKTKKLSSLNWNEKTGYGLLNANNALSEPYVEDMFEHNNNKSEAKQIPFNKLISAQLSNKDRIDWYYVNSEFKGSLNLFFSVKATIKISLISDKKTIEKEIPSTKAVEVYLDEGVTYLQIELLTLNKEQEIGYQFIPQFKIFEDEYESNETIEQAYGVSSLNLNLTGTLHSDSDKDWYKIKVNEKSIIQLEAVPVAYSTRTDLEIIFFKQGTNQQPIDHDGIGKSEETVILASEGEYYICVRNILQGNPNAIYQLKINQKIPNNQQNLTLSETEIWDEDIGKVIVK